MVKINTSRLHGRLEWVVKGKRRESFIGSKFSESLKIGRPSEGKKEDREAGEWPLW